MNTHPTWIVKFIHNSKVNAVKIVDWEHHHEVATIRDVYTHNGQESDGAKAARLITAAPELLEALNNLDILTNIPAVRHALNKAGYMAQFQTAKHDAMLAIKAARE